jgi:hypothetical protein
VGTKVFFAGGSTPSGTISSEVDIYDTSTSQWLTPITLPQARTYMSVAVVGNIVIFAGGYNGSSETTEVDIYNSSTGTLIHGNWLPQAAQSQYITVTTVGSKALFAAGSNGFDTVSTIGVYDASSGQWSNHTLTQTRGLITTATVGEEVRASAH